MMPHHRTILFSVLLLLAAGVLPGHAYEAFQGPTELIQHDPAKAYRGYTLFSPFRGSNTYLIDMDGNVIHMWPYPEGWAAEGMETVEKHARLLEDGTLLRGHVNRAAGHNSPTWFLYDWDGNVLWQYKDPRPGYSAHHDFRIIWNRKLQKRTFMYVTTRSLSLEAAARLGLDSEPPDAPAGMGGPAIAGQHSAPDGLVEVDMEGNLIWEWNIADHTIQDVNPDADNYAGTGKTIADYPGRLDINFGAGRSGDWIHINSFDYNEALDQIVINNSTDSEFYVIDHGATFVGGDPEKSIALAAGTAGDFVYRFGNPAAYGLGESPSLTHDGQTASNGTQQMFFTHDIQWIREQDVQSAAWDLPGAGHFLIFDNGTRRAGTTFSAVLEIDPYDGDWEKGIYVPETRAGYTRKGGGFHRTALMQSNQVVWYYQSRLPNSFFGNYISGCQRLPNGNTLICSGPHGHFFEVTREGDVVWEYINPVGDRTRGDYGIYTVMTDAAGDGFNAVFRCVRYDADYPGLQGKVLTPKGKITEIHSKAPEKP
jgi:hypothetical protein